MWLRSWQMEYYWKWYMFLAGLALTHILGDSSPSFRTCSCMEGAPVILEETWASKRRGLHTRRTVGSGASFSPATNWTFSEWLVSYSSSSHVDLETLGFICSWTFSDVRKVCWGSSLETKEVEIPNYISNLLPDTSITREWRLGTRF